MGVGVGGRRSSACLSRKEVGWATSTPASHLSRDSRDIAGYRGS